MEQWSSALIGILSVLAIVGNGGVVYLVIARRTLHKTANWFVLSLAIADFLFSASYLPLIALIEHKGVGHGVGAHISLLVIYYLTAASITNLCVMTLDRYIAIVQPLRYVTFMRTTRVGVLISSAWLAALVRPMIFLRAVPQKPGLSLRHVAGILLYHIIPCIALIAYTARILLIVRRHSRHTAALQAQLQHNYPLGSRDKEVAPRYHVPLHGNSRESLSARMLVVVVGFCVVYLVLMMALAAQLSFGDNRVEKFRPIVLLFMILNSTVNPLAYAFFKTDIKRELRGGLCCLM